MITLHSTNAVTAVVKCREGKLDPALLDSVLVRATEDTADRSCCQFKQDVAGDYVCTVLGFINGILPELTGQHLVKKVDDETGQVGYQVAKFPLKVRKTDKEAKA